MHLTTTLTPMQITVTADGKHFGTWDNWVVVNLAVQTRLHVCPCCGTEIAATTELHCPHCDFELQEEFLATHPSMVAAIERGLAK